jgi:hypothetical protein
LPAWLAEITHEPTALKVTTPAATEHTDNELFATAMVGARNASLSTDTVYVLPGVAGDGGVERNVKFWAILFTVTVCESTADR